MSTSIREWLWRHVLSKLKLGQIVEAQLKKDAASTQHRPLSPEPIGATHPAGMARSDRVNVQPTYRPEVFDVRNMDDAKKIILTSETGTTSRERWELETPYLVAEIGRLLDIDNNSIVLDYGCGIGRLSKGLIEAYGCSVVGVDISPSMLQLAQQYVQSDRFEGRTPTMLDSMIAGGFRATARCRNLGDSALRKTRCRPSTDRIRSSRLAVDFYVLNLHDRAIPSDRGWISDNVSVEQLLARRFDTVAKGTTCRSR